MHSVSNTDDGLRAIIPFRQVWCFDFEFRHAEGEPPVPLCLVAKELFSGEAFKVWHDELRAMRRLPFDTGSDSLCVSYYVPAEIGCLLALQLPLPENMLDPWAEHRVQTNGRRLSTGNSLLGALAIRGIAHRVSESQKASAINLITGSENHSIAEQKNILDYCESDVDGLIALVRVMAPSIDWPRAQIRARYLKAVAKIERNGIPIDNVMYRLFMSERDKIKRRLVRLVDRQFGVYDGTTFKIDRFARRLRELEISWPRKESGRLDLEDKVFKEQATLHPFLRPLRELRQTLNALRLSDLQIGADRRCRTMLSPFASVTGRNQPSNARFPFGPAKWLRGVIKPEPGHGLAYIDYAAQENAIAAALSGDERMIEAYEKGDPYLGFAQLAGLAPPDATKTSHKAIRDRCKEVVLGVNYGIGAATMAAKMEATVAEARELLQLHSQTFRKFWDWSSRTVDDAVLTGVMEATFGWRRLVNSTDKPTSLMNWHMQANAAEMLRLACISGTEAGIEVCAPVHDALLISAPLHRLKEDVEHMRELMTKASQAVTGGLAVRTDVTVVESPDRYMDERGIEMWNRIVSLLNVPEARYSKSV